MIHLTEDVKLNASIDKLYLQLENTTHIIESIYQVYQQLESMTQYIENETRRNEASVRMLYNRLLSEDVAQQVNNSSSLQLSEMFENEIRWLILDILESPGQYQDYPAASCATVLWFAPSSPSGLYWVRSSNGSAVRVYCDMIRLCGNTIGGWMRVAELDMTDNSIQCPSGLRLNDNNLRTCGIISSGNQACSSATFNLNGIKYSSVHGVIRAYGCGTPDAYGIAQERQSSDLDIDSNYVDGISLTYGMTPRQHIWTFAVDNDKTGCGNSPSFVHSDYYCGNITGTPSCSPNNQNIQWNGGSCGTQSQCCSLNNPTQFYKKLPQPTTDDIEMRLCRDQSAGNENIFIEMIYIYVQ